MYKAKIIIIISAAIICFSSEVFSQDSIQSKKGTTVYSVAVNIVPDQFNIPLIGFVNLAFGSHNSAHIGFVNWNENDFTGAQISFINTVGGSVNGTQLGFINTCADSLYGAQIGFINTVAKCSDGAQIGFVNTCADSMKGIQFSFINTVSKSIDGAQIGFVNTTGSYTNGTQIGFVNTTGRRVKGFQLGFVNFADTIEKGIPIGFLSVVKKGGYRAVEFSVTEMYPVNLSYKIGVKGFYTSFIASYNPNLDRNFALGFGIGSIIPLNKTIYFNPEIQSQNSIISEDQMILSLATNFGFCVSPKFHLSVGPSVVWNYTNENNLNKPFFSIFKNEINKSNNLIVGLRLAMRYNFID